MKLSVNIPDWLADAARQTNPDRPLGELVRDALVANLPDWRKHTSDTTTARELRATLRAQRAEAAYTAALAAEAREAAKPVRRRPRRPAAGSATPPAGPQARASKPVTKAAGR